MPPSAYVQDASEWASTLVRAERERGHPDPVSSVARQGKVTKGAIWALVYRPPKRIAAEVYFAMGHLYERECARQAERFAAERQRTEAKTRIGAALMRVADALDSAADRLVSANHEDLD